MKCQVLGPFYIFHCFRRWQTFQNYQQSRRRETWARILAAGGENNSKVKKSEQGRIFWLQKSLSVLLSEQHYWNDVADAVHSRKKEKNIGKSNANIANMCWHIIQKMIQLFQVCKMSPQQICHPSSMCQGQLWSFSLAIGAFSKNAAHSGKFMCLIIRELHLGLTSKKFYVECIFPSKSFTLLKIFKATIRKAKQIQPICASPRYL